MITNSKQTVKFLEEAQEDIHSGDLLLLRNRTRPSNIFIRVFGRTKYVHVGTAYWENVELRCLDTVPWAGARNTSFSDLVKKYPNQWDVFEPLIAVAEAHGSTYDPEVTCKVMKEFVGKPYGWFNILLVSFLHFPFIRLFVKPATNDAVISKYPPFCSQARAIADRKAGLDPVKFLADHVTEPGDLSRSLLYKYKFTLSG